MSDELWFFVIFMVITCPAVIITLYFKDLVMRAVRSGFRAAPRPGSDPAQPDTSEGTYYYLNANQEPVGPLQFKVLMQLRDIGAITDSTLAAAEGETQWHPLAEILASPSRTVPKRPPVPK